VHPLDEFRSFTTEHVVVLAAIALFTGVAIALARRGGPSAHPTPAERAIGWAYLAAWVTTFTALGLQLLGPDRVLPLQMCHLTGAAAALLLITRRRWLRPLVYFWGLALCTQALSTPTLTEGLATWPFWFFWITHGLIVGVAAYDIAVLGYRPGLRDYGIACAGAALYVAIVLPLDIAFGWNYGFLGPDKPEARTIVDVLGPWPQRIAVMVVIVAAAMAVLLLPWWLFRKIRA
jgi:hypothetical integral membrane protein (TIGR02206 family)